MAASMTGFGRGVVQSKSVRYVVEARSVNNRFCEVRVSAPKEMLKLEHDLAIQVRETFARGKFDLWLKAESIREKGDDQLEEKQIIERFKKLDRVRKKLKITTELSLEAALESHAGNHVQQEREVEADHLFEKAAAKALQALKVFRETEGKHLVADILGRLKLIRRAVSQVSRIASEGIESRTERMRKRVEELVSGASIDEARLATELAILAEKGDVTEELVRLQGHLERLEKLLSSKESIGRNIDFLLQEIHRETNTIGSKSLELGVTEEVVLIKSEIEKIREQAQNLE